MPSLYSLLILCSIIIISYSVYFYTITGLIAGALFLIAGIFTMIKTPVSRNHSSGENTRESGYSFKRMAIQSTQKAALPLVISAIVVMQIASMLEYKAIPETSRSFIAVVQNVRLLNYSKEVTLNFYDKNEAGIRSRARCYAHRKLDLTVGDEIEILKRPSEIKLDKGDSFFTKALRREGFFYTFYLNSADDFRMIQNAPPTKKSAIRSAIEKNIDTLFDKKTAPVLKALYFGNKNYIEKALIQDFKRAGALHILAASGLHVGIIASMIFFSLLVFRINKKILTLITLAAIFFYLYITDMPVSLLRAFTMFSIFAVQYILDLEKNIFNTLFITAIAILVIYPYDLYDLGFQLSFGATIGILLFFRFYRESFSKLPSFFSNSLGVTLAAQVFVLPVILIHLNEINLIGIISNLVLIPGMALTLILSVSTNILSLVSVHVSGIFAFMTDRVLQGNVYIVENLSGLCGHFSPSVSKYKLLLPYLFVLMPLIPIKKLKRLMPLFIIAGFLSAWAVLTDFSIPEERELAFLKTAESSAVLYKDGENAALTGTFQEDESIERILKYITNSNIRRVELFILDTDYKNLWCYNRLMKRAVVARCCISPEAISSFYFKKICETIDNDGIELEIKNLRYEKLPRRADLRQLLLDPRANIIKIYSRFTGDNSKIKGEDIPIVYL